MTSQTSIHNDKISSQTREDAKLHYNFEESSTKFDHSSSLKITTSIDKNKETSTYLHQMQKGKLIQPFGCLFALDEKTFKVIAYSENAFEMLTMTSHAVPSMEDRPFIGIGTDLRTVFKSQGACALEKAFGFGDVNVLNPILVHCKASGKPFYAIMHRVKGGLVVEFEPVKAFDVTMVASGALQSYKLAAKAIKSLQSLQSGSVQRLCETMVQEVFELTGYDRVMVYKFHEDDHGEVLAEVKRSGLDLEPYLGLHYPATDIPQASRFLFMKNKVRMICDCRAKHVKVVQDDEISFELSLCGSTLRAPHGCHVEYMENMRSIASLVMAIVVNEGTESSLRLWGLVVCHHTTPRFVPFPLRYACEFLTQLFGVHISKEQELESQNLEMEVLRTQTMLCKMLLRDSPLGIIAQNPNIKDLVKCQGAALLYNNKIWKLGTTPTDFQIQDIASWFFETHKDSTGLSTDSLLDAGYPGVHSLENSLCGMACARVDANHMMFWFRANVRTEIKWGGAKDEPWDRDIASKMHPRTSFKAFLDVVKNRSVPWKEYETDAIHSLQIIVRNSFRDSDANLVYSKINELTLVVTDEMVRLIETANVPIFAVDSDGLVNGWNSKISELTGLLVDGALGKHLLDLVDVDSVSMVKRMLDHALQGKEAKNVHLEMRNCANSESRLISLVANLCASRDINGNVAGLCFIAQDITSQKGVMDKFIKLEGDYKAIVHSPNPLIPPIFGSDQFGWCSEWNNAMVKLSGWTRAQIVDKMLLGEVFGIAQEACCRLKDHESFVSLGIALAGRDESDKIPFGFFTREGAYVECLLCVTKKIEGVFCFLQLASHELQEALHVQKMAQQSALKSLKALAYWKRQIKNPLNGIRFSSKKLLESNTDGRQKKLLETSVQCQRQLENILDDSDIDTIVNGRLELEMEEFVLHEALIASLSQAMLKSNDRGIQIAHNFDEEITFEALYGDRLRLQQVLADFTTLSLDFTQPGGLVRIQVCLTKKHLGDTFYHARVLFRISHTGRGIPEKLLNEMFESEGSALTDDGISLLISRKLVKLMNGDVQYLREEGCSSFIISLELALAHNKKV